MVMPPSMLRRISGADAKVEPEHEPSKDRMESPREDDLKDTEDKAEDGPLYNFFTVEEGATESPGEVHQAAFHLILHPAVPLLYKLKYLIMSVTVVALQTLAIAAMLISVTEMASDAVLVQFTEMHTLDWFMHILLCILVGFVVHQELEQSQIAGMMVTQAFEDDAGKVSVGWSLPLFFILRVRQHILIPLTVATAPILAIEEGLNAMNVALNVMAILFIFDLDDGALTCLFSRAQRAYLETVEIPIDAREQSRLGWLVPGLTFCSFTSTILPILLYDPNAIFCSNAMDQKFAGFFSEGEPVKTNALITSAAFGVLGLLQLIHRLVRDREGMGLKMWDAIISLACIGLSVYLGIYLGDVIHEMSSRRLSEAGSGPPPSTQELNSCNLPAR